VRSRVLFRSDRGHYRRREAPDPQRQQRGQQASEAARHKRKGVISAEAAHRARRETRRARRRLMGGEDLGDIPAGLGRRPGAGESTLNPTPRQGRSRGYSAPINPQPKDMSDQNDDN
jgi:hypothetical protein